MDIIKIVNHHFLMAVHIITKLTWMAMEQWTMMDGYISQENKLSHLGNEKYEKNNYSNRLTAFNKQ